MEKNANQSTGFPQVQVFHLTMDNAEDQDELNRRFRKPGESEYDPSTGGWFAPANDQPKRPANDQGRG